MIEMKFVHIVVLTQGGDIALIEAYSSSAAAEARYDQIVADSDYETDEDGVMVNHPEDTLDWKKMEIREGDNVCESAD